MWGFVYTSIYLLHVNIARACIILKKYVHIEEFETEIFGVFLNILFSQSLHQTTKHIAYYIGAVLAPLTYQFNRRESKYIIGKL